MPCKLLQVNNLQIHFHTRDGLIKAVDDISFDVLRGETIAIVGESGSGKTIACQSLLGLIPSPPGQIEAGSAYFDNEDLLKYSEQEFRKIRGRRIGMIFQNPMTSLNPYMRVSDQLLETIRQHNMHASKKTVRLQALTALKEVGIPEERINEYPHQFSGGMRQRVMIAMAIVTEPDLLIADEPTTALDVTLQQQILQLMKKLQEKYNLTIIFITHDLGIVAGIADRVIVMQNGKIVEQGDTETIFYQTKHPYTLKLLNSIPKGQKPKRSLNNDLLKVENIRTYFPVYSNDFFTRVTGFNKAVDGVSLTIKTGEMFGLVGESGSGKSTLGRSIIQLLRIKSGNIILEGKPLQTLSGRALSAARRDFQMIFQDPYASLNPRMSVFDTLAEPLLKHKIVDKKEVLLAVNNLIDSVGLSRKSIRKYPHEFSGGQRQRIAIARAIAVKPKLIIADEPVSALDVTIQAQILDLLLQLMNDHQLTMLFISHDLSVVRYVCDRIAVMHKGQIVESGETDTLFRHPRHEYTKTLLSAIPIPDPQEERKRMLNNSLQHSKNSAQPV